MAMPRDVSKMSLDELIDIMCEEVWDGQDWSSSRLVEYLSYAYWSPHIGLCTLAGFDHRCCDKGNNNAPANFNFTSALDPGAFMSYKNENSAAEEQLLTHMNEDIDRLRGFWENSGNDIEDRKYPPAFFIEWALSIGIRPSWLKWAFKRKLYIPKREEGKTPPLDFDKTSITCPPELAMATQAGAHADAPAAKGEALPVVSPSIKEIPGKIPNVTSGKLAIKAAWKIECETGKRATAKQVIKMLQSWVDHKDNPEAVTELTEKIPHGVKWVTGAGIEHNYEIKTCEKTLETWNKSRA